MELSELAGHSDASKSNESAATNRSDIRTGAPTGSLGNSRFRLFSIDDVLTEPSPEWRVDGLLPVGALSMIYAPQAQFKTFFSLDIALSIATGAPFHGRKVKQGAVVYV